jgi:cytoskeletal protein CcmA (bactofilin family)
VAASIEQKLDFLLKKIGYVASKTGIAEDSTLSGTKKAPFGEAIPSPLVVPANSVWAQASEIPATPPGADTPYVRVYLSGSSGHRMTVDNTVSGNRTFIARSTYNNNSSSILGDWIDTSFGADYIIEVYKGDPNSGGVKLSAAGSGSNDTWFFDYSSGVLNFNGTVVPSGVTSTNIYIVGYRYIGIKGVATPGGSASFTDVSTGGLSVTGIATIFNTTDNTLGNENTGSVQLDGGMGIAKNLTVKQNLHVGGYAEFVGVATFKGGTINLGDADTDDINVGGEFVSDLIPDVDDTYSLGSSSKQWKNLFINGHAELDNTVISGVSTFSSPLDINTDVDIDGHTELDNVNIAGVTTFQSNAFFGDADYIQMGDAQDLKIGHVGSYSVILDQGEGNLSIGGDGFVDIMNTALDEYKARFTTNGSVELYFDNVNKFETTGYGATVFGTLQSQQLNVTGVSTYTGDADFNGHVDIDGHTELDNVNISGIVTAFDLDVDGQTELDHLNVAGVSTYTGDADFNGHVDIDGHTELDNVNVSGVTTTGGLLDINAGGQANTFKVEDLTDNRVVIAGTGGELEDDANLTFNGSTLSVGVDLDVDGHTELDNVNISGVTTVAGNIDANGDLDVDGHTNLDNLSVSGVSTFAGNITGTGDLTLTDTDTGSSAGPEFKLFRNSASPADADYIGQIKFAGESDTGVERNYAKITGKILDASNGTEDGILEFAHIKAGSQNISARFRSDSLQLLNGTNFSVAGDSTFTGAIDANGDLDVDGHTNLDNVSVAGVSTFTGTIDANSDLDVDGHTNLDNVSVAGVSTFTGAIDANGDLDVDGHTNLDNVDIAGVTTTSSLLDINAGGQANTFKVEDLTDNRVVIAGTGGELEDDANLTFNGSTLAVGVNLDVTGDLNVDGHTNLDNVSVAGVTTFTGAIDANGDLDVDGTTELDVLNVAETATFSANIDANGDLDVDGHTNLDNVSVAGVSTFTGAIDADGNVDVAGTLDVDGHTELDNVNISGIATATAFHTGAEGSAIRVTSNTISGPAEMFIDPAGVGDNTGALRIKGDLFVDGTQTVINSTTIELGDFIVGIATTATTDSLADGAGIKIGPDNTFLYDHPNTSLKSSENLNLASSKVYKIDGTDVLSATTLGSGVVNSSLTSLGTLLGLTVSGQTTLNTLGVTGVSTFTGAIDANGDLDVDGHTNLDNVSVAGVTTTSGLLDIDAGGRANTFIVEDLTNNRVVLAGTGGELEDDSNLTFNGSTLTVGVGLDVDGHTELDNVNISGVTTFTGGITASGSLNLSGDLDVDGHTNLDNVSVAGVSTFTDNIDANGDLDVDGHTNLDNVSVAGISTFAGNIDANGDLDVDGHTELDNVAISGIVTVTGNIDANSNADINGDLNVNGHTDLDNVDIAGVTTFTGAIDANGNLDVAGTLDVDGHTELDNVNISGVVTATSINATTFIGDGDFVDIDVDGHTELDHVNIAGVVTATTINATTINATTFAGDGDFVDIDVDGHTNLDNVSVAGVTTFAGKIVGAATDNVIPFLYSTMGDLPNAGTYHGAFAHVHNQGKGFFAHGGNWYELVNKEQNGTVGTGTERYDVGYIDAAGSNVTGVSTAATSVAATLNVGAGGTVLNASVNNSRVGINSTTPAYALDVVGDINSSTDIKVNGVSIVSQGASLDDVVALAIALG